MVQGFMHKELLTELTTVPGVTNHSLKYFHDEAFHRQMLESQKEFVCAPNANDCVSGGCCW